MWSKCKNNLIQYKYPILIGSITVFFLAILPKYSYVYDQITFATWTEWIIKEGIGNIYKHTEVNYLPLYLYVLEIFGNITRSYQSAFINMYYLKIIALFFDISSIALVYKILGKLNLSKNKILFLLLNVVLFYNTLLWGQIDSIHTFFLLFTVYLLLERKSFFAVLAFVLTVNIKYQSLIYAPIIFLLLLPQIIKTPTLIIKYLFYGSCLQFVCLLPYLARGGDLNSIFNVIGNSVGFFPYISMNAFNFWYLIVGPGKAWSNDTQIFYIFSYRTWGLILFAVGYLLALTPLIKILLNKIKFKEYFNWNDLSVIAMTIILCTYLFFFFPTQMHERYIHPALIFAGIWAVLNCKYALYLIISLGYFLNMEKILEFLPFDHGSIIIFSSRLIATIYSLGLILGFYYLYKPILSTIFKRYLISKLLIKRLL